MLEEILSEYEDGGAEIPPLPYSITVWFDGTLDDHSHFSLCAALYWYCVYNHDGQWSLEYKIMGNIGFNPGPLSDGPEEGDEDAIYTALCEKEITPIQVVKAIVDFRAVRDQEDE